MRVLPFPRGAKADGETPKRDGFWHRLSLAIDSLAAYQVKHALTEHELRRVDEEIMRCRQLMFPQPPRLGAIAYRLPARHALVPIKVRG